ncbi:hypothetical protein BDP27DRAFT_1066198 [Rhodocollybia butyracea]|uniref:Uncharacterized protein n=1 Tax=Rhodocollybia butyracea TaxID=206335 RepID=A0A9P5P5S9_9AGAR|nr:hypothetical protein BDP27DRAFT_1066198 [Rhodocollybia butyracea]
MHDLPSNTKGLRSFVSPRAVGNVCVEYRDSHRSSTTEILLTGSHFSPVLVVHGNNNTCTAGMGRYRFGHLSCCSLSLDILGATGVILSRHFQFSECFYYIYAQGTGFRSTELLRPSYCGLANKPARPGSIHILLDMVLSKSALCLPVRVGMDAQPNKASKQNLLLVLVLAPG